MNLNIAAQEQKKVEQAMAGLMQELQTLAPHPDYPTYKGPLFAAVEDGIKAPADYDGMMGEVVMESVLGTSFAQAAADTLSNVIDAVSHFVQDRPKQTLSGNFNCTTIRDEMMQKYLADLPRRMGVERWLAHHQKKLNGLREMARRYAAPRPAFA